MNKYLRYGLLFCLVTFLVTCRTNYEPPITTTDLNYLVVDGFLNNSSDSTYIRLSHTRKVDSIRVYTYEQNALLTVENEAGNTQYTFTEVNANGLYSVPGMSLDVNQKYRLRIKTLEGRQYLSDNITVTYTPPIDSISWKRTNEGLTVFANCHNPQNNTRYYRWEFSETYEYHAQFLSLLEYDYDALTPGTLKLRDPANYVYICYKTRNSSDIMLASSEKLSEDIISEYPLRKIEQYESELSVKYSMFVREYSMSVDAYRYYQNLQKITEQTGSIFGSLPSEISGNMHSVDKPGEPVLGYVTACNTDSKRIFITNADATPWPYDHLCQDFLVNNNIIDIKAFFYQSDFIPIQYVNASPNSPIIAGQKECADCRLQGGTLVRPDFW